jgi:hypothetical protein
MSRAKTLPRTRAQSRRRPQPTTPAATEPRLSGEKRNALLALLLAAATVALYVPVLGNRFVVWDDHEYVTGNPHIRKLDWATVKWAFASTYAANWHPLTWLSHALDYRLFALNPLGHHLGNVLLHALNAALLFLLLAWMTKRTGPSLLVAALFAFHPLNVESVAWVAERKSVLSTLFFLLAIGAYVWYARKPDWRRYLLVFAMFALGLMAKPMVITLPFVLLLLDYWPLERFAIRSSGDERFSKLLLEKVPLLLLSAASAWVTLVAQHAAVRSVEQLSLTIRAENAVVSYSLYLWKMVWPARLAALYPHPANTLPMWQVLVSAALLIAITVLVLKFRDKRYLAVGWFWFLGTLVPVIGLVQVGEAAMADRYAYISLIGIFLMIAWTLDDWANERNVSTTWRLVPALCALAALGFVTFRQLDVWSSEYSLWAHAAVVTAPNPYAEAVLAAALLNPDAAMSAEDLQSFDTEPKRLDEARRRYDDALATYRGLAEQNRDAYLPDMAATVSNLGDVARLQHQLDEARLHYEEAMQDYREAAAKNPELHRANMATTLSELADVDRRLNRLDEARANDAAALEIYRQLAQQDPDKYQPKMVDTLVNLGLLEQAAGHPDQAYAHFTEALQIGRKLAQQNPSAYLPNLAGRLVNLGSFEQQQKHLDDARHHYEEALAIYRKLAQQNPDAFLPATATATNDLANLDLAEDRGEEAQQQFGQALAAVWQVAQHDPNQYLPELAWELSTLSRVEGMLNKLDDSRQHLEEALAIYRKLAQQDPDRYLPELAAALNNLGLLDRLLKRPDESRAYYTEAIAIYRRLAQAHPDRFAGEIARAEASLAQAGRNAQAQ